MQKIIWSVLVSTSIAACGGMANDPIGADQEPLSPTSDTCTSESESGTAATDCSQVQCPPPPEDWCESDRGDTSLPQWLVEYWNQSCNGAESICGNGIIDEDEVCDDGNATGGDGCAADCGFVEVGFECDASGQACVPRP